MEGSFGVESFMTKKAGMKWTKIINSVSAYLGVFVPSAVIFLSAVWWVLAGHPMSTDYHTAANWFRLAANQGLTDAQCNLATCYELGWGVPRDADQACYWYEKAAAQNDPEAINALKRLRGR